MKNVSSKRLQATWFHKYNTVRWQKYINGGQVRVARARDQKRRSNRRILWLWKENKRNPYGDLILCTLTVVMGTQPWTHVIKLHKTKYTDELPRWLTGRESTCWCRRCGFDPWVRKIPWRTKWHLTPVFLPGKFRGQSLAGCSPWIAKSWTWLSDWACTQISIHKWVH